MQLKPSKEAEMLALMREKEAIGTPGDRRALDQLREPDGLLVPDRAGDRSGRPVPLRTGHWPARCSRSGRSARWPTSSSPPTQSCCARWAG